MPRQQKKQKPKAKRAKKQLGPSTTSSRRMGGAVIPRTPPLSHHRLARDVARYIDSLFRDVLCDELELPAPGFTHRYTPYSLSGRLSLTAGTTIANTMVAVNPYHMLWPNVDYDKPNSAAAEINVIVPTVFTNASTNTNGAIPNGAEQTAVTLNGMMSASSTEPWEADVRVHGIRFRVNYFGTELNKGGLIYAIHNSGHKSLLCQFETNNTAATNGSLSSWTAVNALSQATDLCQTANMGDSFEFVWRPQDLHFHTVKSHYPAVGAHATAASGNTEISAQNVLPTTTDATRPCPNGWVTGFLIAPATATAATAVPYSVDIEWIGDVRMAKMDSATAANVGYNQITGTKTPHEDPVLIAHAHNALSYVHAARQARAIPSRQQNLAVKAGSFVTKEFKSLSASALTGAAESLGSRMFGGIAAAA